jgi:FlaA1/EpsC-like NDP-sugar epimerase
MNKAKTGLLPITDLAMTRFNISLEEGVEMVLWSLEHALGGEILVPKIPSYRIGDVAEAIGPNCKRKIVGIRPGEKLHEEMITSSDSPSTVDLGEYYAILSTGQQNNMSTYIQNIKAQKVPTGFAYESGSNPDFLSVVEIRELIKAHMNPEFEPV